MNEARARVLSAITQALGDAGCRARTEPPVMAIPESNEDSYNLAARFTAELAALEGWATLVRDRSECATSLAAYLRERAVRSLAVQSSELAADIASRLRDLDVSPAREHSKLELAAFDCALLEARSLLADTGSVIVVLDNAEDRVLPYLPRTCVFVAELATLHATLSARAQSCIADATTDGTRGEALIVAGPSRSADIEKTLVLGAHGPQAVAVFFIENP